MNFQTLFLFILTFIHPLSIASNTLPQDAQELLNSLPDKAVTYEVVLERAVAKSDSFQALKVEENLIEIPKLQAEGLTLLNVKASSNYTDDQKEPTNAFSFTRQIISQHSLGLEKRFQTGTSLSAEINHGKYFFQLPAIPGFASTPQIYQSLASVSLVQNLLKDSFGYSTRNKIKAADLASEAAKLQFEDKVQNWSLDLAKVFYDAWLAKENHQASLDGFERRKRILNVTRIRSKRGTSEQPDLLQALAANTDAELMTKDAHLNLADKWRALVISLKLPKAWIEIDPVYIPLKIKDETLPAKEACKRLSSKDTVKPNYSVEYLEKLTKSTELQLKATRNDRLPNVDLVGSYTVNSVDTTSRSQTFTEVQDRDFPAWTVGVQVTYPLGNPIADSQYRQAFVDKTQSENRLQEAKDQLELAWIALCERMTLLEKKESDYSQSVKQQEQREKLESNRFNLGRVPLLNVIQSGDDQTRARQNLIQTQANLQMTALQILSMERKLFDRVKGYIQ